MAPQFQANCAEFRVSSKYPLMDALNEESDFAFSYLKSKSGISSSVLISALFSPSQGMLDKKTRFQLIH